MATPLSDLSIVITRPVHQAAVLQNNLSELGAKVILFPCIEIKSVSVKETSIPLNEVDIFIFISPNSVKYGFQFKPDLLNQTKPDCQIAAVGESTAQALNAHNADQIITPTGQFDSEGLLSTSLLQDVQNKSILIVKGVGGNPLLKDTLIARGANVDSIDVYQRSLPKTPDIMSLPNSIDLVLFTSSQSAVNFFALVPVERYQDLFKCQTIVGHPKIGQKVSSLGFKKLPIIAASPSDRDFLDAITQWAHKL